ncbi:DUF4178 domain-containing protein [Leptothrix ochracea]|uniref:DUF4178 domain-containing protein n=2 Tax=Leptothrix ochracea TaxID=735331 RepID=UPI0034E1C65F
MTHRSYSALCPNCGGRVEFRSAASVSSVCSFCRSTLVREGEALRRIGQSAELFDDHSPLQLGASGKYMGEAFTLVGRLQWQSPDARWTEWHALFSNGSGGWLSEDNGAYVFSFDAELSHPEIASLQAGQDCNLSGQHWSVASVVSATVSAAEGELPHPLPQGAVLIADLRHEAGEVATLQSDVSTVSVGRPVRLAELALQGLREISEKKQDGRSIACPSCGASIAIQLDSTKAVTCGQCKAVVDVSKGVGADLSFYAQNTPFEPLLPLGSTATLSLASHALPWQVVGAMERCDLPNGADEDFEQSFWHEYLLYHPQEGFVFLVDAEDGWSWMKPLTGAPKLKSDLARWAGQDYKRRWSYSAKTTCVVGEFYWQAHRGEQHHVMDFEGQGQARRHRMSREQQGQEVVWSGGELIEAGTLMDAFAIPADQRSAFKRDAAPLHALGDPARWPLWIALAVIVLIVFSAAFCTNDSCKDARTVFGENSAEYQQCLRQPSRSGMSFNSGSGGGSWGGFSSSGGGHK